MKPTSRRIFTTGKALSIFGAALLLALTFAGADAQAAKPIKFGYVGGISGGCGGLTQDAVRAMKMATKEINDAGGIIGRKLEVIYRDSKTKPDEGAKQARDLIVSDKVDLLTGVCSSSIFMAVNPVAKEYGVPLVSAISGTHRTTIDFGHPYVYQTQPNTMIEGAAIAEYVHRKGWMRLVTIGLDYEWGRTTVAVFEEELKKRNPNIKIVKRLWPKWAETNMSPFITAALAEKPDAVMAVVCCTTANAMVKQGNSYNFFKRTNVLTFLSTETLMAMGTDMPDGVHGWARAPFYALNTAKGLAFVTKFYKLHGVYPNDWGNLAYDMMYYLKEGIEHAGSMDPLKLRTAMSSFTYDGLRGKIKMRFIDNTADSPSYIGVTKKIAAYPFPIMVNVQRIPGKITLPSEAKVRELRAAVAKK